MSSIQTLQSTINFVSPFVQNRPLALSGNLEPILSAANQVMRTILGPPFVWNWNRKEISFSLSAGTQDYSQAITDFGYIEAASVTDSNGNITQLQEVKQTYISKGKDQAQPQYISAVLDDNSGNITFRFSAVPDATYTATVAYQKKVTPFVSPGDLWPLPDHYSYVYNWGVLALTFLYTKDSRFQFANQQFKATLLGNAEGLTEMQKNVFLANWEFITRQAETTDLKTQAGNQSRLV